jgi:glucose/mannose-6-phosphate isomerase
MLDTAGAAQKLDDRSLVERLDPHGELARIEGLPEQCTESWQVASAVDLPADLGDVRQVVVLGMGGSAIGGDLLRVLAAPQSKAPISVLRGYDVPASINHQTLVIACSHSGMTEETKSAFDQALRLNARVVVVTTGGDLAIKARDGGLPTIAYQYDGEPRSALGHQLMALLAIGQAAGLLEGQGDAVVEAVSVMQEQRAQLGAQAPFESNPAKQLAARLHGRLPVVVGAGVLAEVAHRWKTQINENAKSWAVWEELPELDHNTIVGFPLPKATVENMHVVFLWHPALHPRVLLRYEATADELSRAGVSHERIEAKGSSPLSQVLSAIYFGDLASYYLALLNDVEPSPVEAIDRLKTRLAGR